MIFFSQALNFAIQYFTNSSVNEIKKSYSTKKICPASGMGRYIPSLSKINPVQLTDRTAFNDLNNVVANIMYDPVQH